VTGIGRIGGPRGLLGTLVLIALVAFVALSGDEAGDGDPGESAPAPAGSADPGGVRAEVVSVTDGDTIEVRLDGRTEDVRYIGIDTPEVDPSIGVECFGAEASDLNRRLVGGRTVRLVFDDELRDRYGRLLAYVYAGPRFVNAEIVRRGYARTLTIEPNSDRAPLFARLESEAGREGRGLWGRC
jgi:micrococcal nuclease